MKVTYLLGAGASAIGVPVVEKQLIEMKNHLERKNELLEKFGKIEGYFEDLNLIIQIMEGKKPIFKKAFEFRSIDHLAYSIYQNSQIDEKYEKLKRVLSVFFFIYQYENNIDYRYDYFLKQIGFTKYGGFPKDKGILSWNYDFQLQYSVQNLLPETNERYSGRVSVSTPSSIKYLPNTGLVRLQKDQEIDVLHLNGIATLYKNQRDNFNPLIEDDPKSLIEKFGSYENMRSHVQFAWENIQNENINDFLKEKIDQVIGDSQTLIIIGYSLPDFNRIIDKYIISKFNGYGKIYIQNTNKAVFDDFNDKYPKDVNNFFRVKFKEDCSFFFTI